MRVASQHNRRDPPDGDEDESTTAHIYLAGGALPRVRAVLRANARLQGMVLAPLGVPRRLPRAGGIYFPFYHGVSADNVRYFRRHLQAFRARGRFISWDEAVEDLGRAGEIDDIRYCLSFDDGHKDWLSVLLPVLHEVEAPATFFITVNNVTSARRSAGRLTWSDCRRLAGSGMSIGSHTISHARLALVGPERARREIAESKAVLEDRIGVPVHDFAAPYGLPGVDYCLERDVRLVQEAGYRSLATTMRGRMSRGDSLYHIRRSGLSAAWPMPAVRRSVRTTAAHR